MGFLLIALVIYYAYVWVAYYSAREWFARLVGKRTGEPSGKSTVATPAGQRLTMVDEAGGAAVAGIDQKLARQVAELVPIKRQMICPPAWVGKVIAPTDGPDAGESVVDEVEEGVEASEGVQGELFSADLEMVRNEEGATSLTSGEDAETFKEGQEVILQVQEIVNEAAANRWGRKELEIELVMVLSQHRRLIGLTAGAGVNAFLIRNCAARLSLQLTEAEVVGLWGG